MGLDAIRQASHTAKNISSHALTSQAHNHMIKVTQENAARNHLVLERTKESAALIAAAASQYFSLPERYAAIGEVQGAVNLRKMDTGQHVESDKENASIFVPNFINIDNKLTEQIQITRALDPLALAVLANDSNAAAVYFVTATEIARYYPDGGLDGLPADLKLTEEIFYTSASPELNPQRKTDWTAVYDDPAALGLMVSALSPVYTNKDEFIGVIGIDFKLSSFGDIIENSALAKGSYSFLIDNNARAIAFPDQAYLDIVNRPRNDQEFGIDLSETTGSFAPIIKNMINGESNVMSLEVNGEEKYIAYVPMGENGWSLATVVSTDTVLNDITPLKENLTAHSKELIFKKLIPLALFALFAITSLAFHFAYRFTLPLRQLTIAAKAIGQRQWNTKMPPQGEDEVGILSKTLADMAKDLESLIGSLESRVSKRTRALKDALGNLEVSNAKLSNEIDERKISEAARADLEAKFRYAFHSAPIGMALMDLTGRVLDPNPKLQELFWPEINKDKDHEHRPLLESVVVEAEREQFKTFQQALKDETINAEFQCIGHDGEIYKIVFFLSAVKSVASDEPYLVLLANDVTNTRHMTELLKQQANHDELTGLQNRRAFSSALKDSTDSTNQKKETQLLYLDLDRFKIVNDTCGHAEGDRLLVEISELIASFVRPTDAVARLGGDEFAILLIGCNQEIAYRIAERIREAVHKYEFHSTDEVFRIGVSIGLVGVDTAMIANKDPQAIADAACYTAKKAGRNRIHVVSSENDEAAEHQGEIRWAQRLRDAMDTDKFVLHGQKLQHLQTTDTQTHIEILLRLYDSDSDELIPPGAFFPAAERFDLLIDIDKWVVSNLIKQLGKHHSTSSPQYSYWVNLSGTSLSDPEFRKFIVAAIEQANLPQGTINFEITEIVVIKNMCNAKEFITALQALGCEISLDDFGTGLSSLSYLRNLDVDYVKIDGSFVKNIVTNKADRLLVKSTIEIAQHLGKQTVVEFVENDDIKNMATSLGADYAQGFGIHHPEDLSTLLNSNLRRTG